MAEAHIKQVPVAITEERIVLSLTREEAKALAIVCRNIAGDPNKSARKFFTDHPNAILNQLENLNVIHQNEVTRSFITGTLRFKDDK